MGEKKEVVVEKKEEIITAQYKLNIHCKQCARSVEEIFYQHEGVHKVEVDVGKGIVTVKGVKIDVVKIREVSERKCRRKVELLTPIPEKKEEKKEVKKEVKKKEEIFTYEVKVFMHCGRCETIIKEEILKHKSVYSVKTDRGKHLCTVKGTIKEDTLIEHIKTTTRKNGTILSKKVEIEEEEEKIEIKKGKDGVEVKKEEIKVTEKIEEVEIKHKEVVAPYFIPCSHPRFADYSHPDYYNYGGYGYTPHYLGYRRPEYHYGDMPEFKDLNYPPFLHCTHSPEFINDENPYACSVM
ncbi:hypothetical protein LUZ61_010723 [Rhynchospora tenuis]|uniref:HMA domain-containing protein n=1 Tax=Rhynchospora tenuis TaxID=198213 RepID=A0AAD6A038_9POAL|nr:hypothetical protein LUZ61_010723 [Rhynchospora tenuis]